jgi:hypothetical protein
MSAAFSYMAQNAPKVSTCLHRARVACAGLKLMLVSHVLSVKNTPMPSALRGKPIAMTA